MKKALALVLLLTIAGLAGCATAPRSSTVYQYRDTPSYSPTRPVYTQTVPQPVYAQQQVSAQEDYNKRLIKQGLLGAATGAIAAEASGGKAGTGALVGAGTNVLGGALLDVLTAPQAQPQQVQQYAPYVSQWNQQNPDTNRVVRKYDSGGNIISEEVYTR